MFSNFWCCRKEGLIYFSVSMQALGKALDDVDEDWVDLVVLGIIC